MGSRNLTPDFLNELAILTQSTDRVLLAFDDSEVKTQWCSLVRLIGVNAEIVETPAGNIAPLGFSSWLGVPTILVSRARLSRAEKFQKRLFDLLFCLAVLPLILPIMAIIALLIRLESSGPVLFIQKRIGSNNKHFSVFKFRSMYVESSDNGGAEGTRRQDNRVTKVGRILRKTSLDEVPQIINVIIGNMSIVGPRPHALYSLAEKKLFWEASKDYWLRHQVKPGITGLAQIRGFRGGGYKC